MIFVASTTMGLESVVKDECLALGFKNIKVFDGRVEFEGDFKDLVKANIYLRCSDRVFIKMAEFKALTYEELFQNIKAINWQDYIDEDGEFPISWVSSVKSKLYSKSDIQRISKKAIVEKLKEKYKREIFLENGALYSIKIQCHKDIFIVMLDSSGESLTKRGYRALKMLAPIKETLAAALVYLSKWKADEVLLDPMCGTGTIAIEAAMIARNIAPGANRNFAAEKWSIIDKNLWTDIRDEAFSNEDLSKELKIYASDIDERSIEIAKENSEKAGIEDDIIFEVKDFKDIESPAKYGAIIVNPPYGERLMGDENIEELYRDFGNLCKKKLAKWSYYIITSYEDFEKSFDKKATKNRKLYNGGIKCYYYQYFGDNIKVDLKNQDNLYEVERIEKEVISVYENIYLSLDEEFLLNLYKENQKSFEQLEATIEKMKKDANLKDEYIKTQIKKRKKLKGSSGAEVVEKFFKYKIKELKKIKGDLLQKLNKLLDKEEKLNLDLSNAIQEVEQLEIIEKLQPVRAEFRNLSLQLDKYQKELEETENKFFKKWYYEIYGTTDKEVLLKAYNSQ